MWNIIKWMSSPSAKEEEAAMSAARHHARDTRTKLPAMEQPRMVGEQSAVQTPPPNSAKQSHTAMPDGTVSFAQPTGGDAQISESIETADNSNPRQGRDVFSHSKAPRNSDLRKGAMAYWRKNTNQERPSDSQYYHDLTSPVSAEWHNPFATSANLSRVTKSNQSTTLSSDLSNLSAFITENSKSYLAGSYARKGQSELTGQTYDKLAASPLDSQELNQYPHYQGGWIPENSYAPAESKDTSTDSAAEVIADPMVQALTAHALGTPDLFSAASEALKETHSEELHQSTFVEDGSFPRAGSAPQMVQAGVDYTPAAEGNAEKRSVEESAGNHAWSLQTGNIEQELVSSLNSIESSPTCDELFEPAASPRSEVVLPSSVSDQAEQSMTLDSLPEQQIVDVRICAADHPETAPEILRALAYDINPDVRFAIAENHNADINVLKILAEDDNPYVAHRARKTIQRVEGGQLKQGSFGRSAGANWLSDRRKSM